MAVEQFLTIRRTVNLNLHLNGVTPFLKEVEPGLCSVKMLVFGENPCGSILPLLLLAPYLPRRFGIQVSCYKPVSKRFILLPFLQPPNLGNSVAEGDSHSLEGGRISITEVRCRMDHAKCYQSIFVCKQSSLMLPQHLATVSASLEKVFSLKGRSRNSLFLMAV